MRVVIGKRLLLAIVVFKLMILGFNIELFIWKVKDVLIGLLVDWGVLGLGLLGRKFNMVLIK